MVRSIRQAQDGQTHHGVDNADKILEALKKAKRILIPLHINPDGDSIGSASALSRILKKWGKEADVVSADPVPKCFLALPEAKKIGHVDPADLNLSRYDLLAVLDIGSLHRISRDENLELPRGLAIINIDHHETNDAFTKLAVVRPQTSSTAEVLFDLVKKWNFALTKGIATYLLIGIIADTRGFRYEETSAQWMEKTAELIRLGADYSAIIEINFKCWSPEALAFWQKALQNRKVRKNGRFIFTTITQEEIKGSGINPDEVSNARSFIVRDIFQAVKTVSITAVFSEERRGKIHCSLRAKPGFNIAKIAEKMGGGGHTESAAFDVSGKMEEVVDKTVTLVEDVLK